MISRRLAGLLINFKKATGHACRSSKDTCARFYCFQGAYGHLMKNRMQFGPAQNNMYPRMYTTVMYLITQGQCIDATINDHSDTQSCQTLQLIIAVFYFFE